MNLVKIMRKIFIFFIILDTCGIARSAEPVPVSNSSSTLFEGFHPSAKVAKNISGLTCFSNKTCLAIADEMIAVQLFKLHLNENPPTIEAGKVISTAFGDLCTDTSNKEKCEEVDLEGVARFQNEVFVTGSMGNKKKSGKPKKKRWFTSKIIIDNINNINAPAASVALISNKKQLEHIFNNQDEIKPYIEKPLQCYGLNIEGLAQINGTIFFGLRSPVSKEEGTAFLVSTNSKNLVAEEERTTNSTLHRLKFEDTNGEPIPDIGIRAIEEIGNRLLIVTGAKEVSAPQKFKHWKYVIEKCEGIVGKEDNLNISFGKNALSRIWIWDPANDTQPEYVTTIDGKYEQKKLEGIAIINIDGMKADLLLAFDDPKKLEPLAVIKNISIPQ